MKNYILFAILPIMFLSSPILGNDEEHDILEIPPKVLDYCESEDGMFDDSCLLLMDNEYTLEDDEFIYEIMTGISLHTDHVHVDSEQILRPLLEQQIENEKTRTRGLILLEQTRSTRSILNQLESDEFKKFKREQRSAPSKGNQ